MQAIRPAPAGHQSAGEFVDDDDFAVFDDVINVALENRVRFERLLHMMQGIDLARIIEIMHAEQPLDFRHAGLGQRHRAAFLVDRIVALGFDRGAIFLRGVALNDRAALQLGNDAINDVILVGGFFRRSGDDQRRARFIDENVVDFVHHCVIKLPLDVFLQGEFHIVAQIIEAKLIIGAISDVREISFLAADRAKVQVTIVLA